MRIIALVTQKGGSGKSTLAASLAVAAKDSREKVFLIDMDPQQSLLKWSATREEKDIPVETITAGKLPRALATLEQNGIDLVILDTPGTDSVATEAAMKAADLCVIPARPTVFDIWSSEVTRARLKALGKDYVFVLNQCPPMQDSPRVQDGATALEAMGGLLTPLIASRADHQQAAREGLGVTEFNPYGKAADEMRQLWSSMRRRLAKVKSVAKPTKRVA
ncbi:MAG TPA: ParA family protein [Beijerinckiaceae bacterium]|jgi:chromosome partitioning protein|nr:ParA family protein [Beijerinckiaceae bacterium]